MTPSEVTAALIRQGKTRAEAQYLALTSHLHYTMGRLWVIDKKGRPYCVKS